MDQTHKTAFISYSWDSEEHQKWVFKLMNQLRKKGVDATMDVIETQNKTVNLNIMMRDNIRDKDYTIIVLTEKYAEKSESLKGGVGFETLLSIPVLKSNPNKLIFLVKYTDSFEDSIPSHLKDYYVINFTNDNEFDVKLNELIRRIYNFSLYEIEPLGKLPDFSSKDQLVNSQEFYKTNISLPNLEPTDLDKNKFMDQKFEEIRILLSNISEELKSNYNYFEFTLQEVTRKKYIYKFFINGNLKIGIKIWIGSFFHSSYQSINLKYGTNLDGEDNSLNESIICEVAKDNTLHLKMNMSLWQNNSLDTPKEIIEEIWKNNISPYLK